LKSVVKLEAALRFFLTPFASTPHCAELSVAELAATELAGTEFAVVEEPRFRAVELLIGAALIRAEKLDMTINSQRKLRHRSQEEGIAQTAAGESTLINTKPSAEYYSQSQI
jgi:hypothetical protein